MNISDTEDQILEELKKLNQNLGGGVGTGGGGGVGAGGAGGASTATAQGGSTVVENTVVDPDEEPQFNDSPVWTTGENGATVSQDSFTSEGRFVFPFPTRVVYIRTDEDIVAEFNSSQYGNRRIPIPASKGEITLGDGGDGFRAGWVNLKLQPSAGGNATVHIIVYR